MNDTNSTSDVLEFAQGQKPALPSGLNILTILTFIGCGLGIIFVIATPALNKFFLSMMDKAQSSGQELTTKQLEDMQKGKAVIQLTQANMLPIMLISIVAIILCFVGALWMRKLKKDGFWIYTTGEILLPVGSFIVLGMAQYTGVVSVLFGLGLPLLFIILYAMQLKYLVK